MKFITENKSLCNSNDVSIYILKMVKVYIDFNVDNIFFK